MVEAEQLLKSEMARFMDSSQPVLRTLKVLQQFTQPSHDGMTLTEIARACAIAPATLGRIVKTLEAEGYIEQVERGRYRANFEIRKVLDMPSRYLSRLARVLDHLVDETRQSSEVILRSHGDLVWHAKREHPDLAITIRARPGFRRGLHELDALSRLFLSALGLDEVRARFNLDGFVATGGEDQPISAAKVCALIEATDPNGVAYDVQGNEHGVRRFCRLVYGVDGVPLHAISIAEAARMNIDIQLHIARNTQLLERYGDVLAEAARATLADPVSSSSQTQDDLQQLWRA